jgi:hypothetical protein
MKIARSPKDRLRALRAGRVSQLLEHTDLDGLPPAAPPRITLNGRPVETGAAFDAVLERAHKETLSATFQQVEHKSEAKEPKYNSYAAGRAAPLSPAQIAANTVTSIWGSRLGFEVAKHAIRPLAGLAADIAFRKNFGLLDRENIDPWNPPASNEINTEHLSSEANPIAQGLSTTGSSDSLSIVDTDVHNSTIPGIQVSVGGELLTLFHARGSVETRKKNDYLTGEIKRRAQECFDQHNIDVEIEHTHGGSDPAKTEHYVQSPYEPSTRGSGRTDGTVTMRIGNQSWQYDLQTYDQRADGSPISRESTSFENIREHLNLLDQFSQGHIDGSDARQRYLARGDYARSWGFEMFTKGRKGIAWDEWKEIVDKQLDKLFENCRPIARWIDDPETPRRVQTPLED